MQIVKEDRSDLRGYAARALGTIGPSAQEAVPFLIGMLNDKDDGNLAYAAEALGKIKAKDKEAIPALVKLLDNEYSWWPMRHAASSITTIAWEHNFRDELPTIRRLARDVQFGQASFAIWILSEWGDKDSLPIFEAAAKSDDSYIQKAGKAALARLEKK